MIRPDEIEDVVAVVSAGLDLLDARVRDTGRVGADYRRLSGDLRADTQAAIAVRTLGDRLAAVFPAARVAGFARRAWPGLMSGFAAIQTATIKGAGLVTDLRRLALIEDVRALATVTFVSRSDIEAEQARLAATFDALTLEASDLGELEAARALTALLGAVVRDLEARGRPLGRVVTYAYPEPIPSLVLAHRLYADASRAGEVAAMNKTRHPAFMPVTGEVLSL